MELAEARDLAALAERAHAERHLRGAGSADELAARSADIAAALDLLARDDPAAAAVLAGSLSRCWQEWGRVEEGLELTIGLLARVGEAGQSGDPRWSRAHLVVGELSFRRGDQEAALAATRFAALGAAALDDRALLAEAETNLARIAFRDGDAPRIFRHARRVQALADGDARLMTKATHMLGWASYTAGDLATAMERFEENAERYGDLGDDLGAAMEWANLGDLALEAGDHQAAARYLAAAFATPGLADDGYLAPSLVRSAGVLLGALGHDERSLELLAAADAAYRAAGLEPDPGDDAAEEVERGVRERLAEREAEIATRGAAMGRGESFAAARAALSGLAGPAGG
ncbi:hypothetical protein E8D34_01330 [Nocardioides sp. GY 10113]|uniref:hypothetical protein n=1 Tax=Nocardioides sp. GY 10113 TaxID=2569761 RepID=UPI0010A925D2|nr:hypothetical protein [Nocardioides sp. GY 10113]TIC89170.1 hypothetical protein E8D34_01330 [Nocardioides sp. GY 10113]